MRKCDYHRIVDGIIVVMFVATLVAMFNGVI
jgi:hypothetical protein